MIDERLKRHDLPTADWMLQQNARRLARLICNYWAQRGKIASVSVERMGGFSDALYQIRSNLVNGKPA